MKKTAAVILNHNLPDYTDMLYESLKPYERNDYHVIVFDNGSDKAGQSKYTSYATGQNVYFGGGFNAAMGMVLDNDCYDSLLFLNNDLTIHNNRKFVKTLRDCMFSKISVIENFDGTGGTLVKKEILPPNIPAFDIVSSTFYNDEETDLKGGCHWKTMKNYGNTQYGSVREVPFIDFQCPLISKRLLKEIGEIHPSLIMGFGIDFLFALTCQDKGWKLGVCDSLTVLHHNSLTVKRGVAGINIQQYCQRAEAGQYDFFYNVKKRFDDYQKLRQKAENYQFP